MDINVIDFLKDIKHFEYYFSNRNLILGLMIVGFVILSVCLAEEIKQEIKNEEWKESLIKTLISVLIIVMVGTGLNAAGMEIVFSVDHMPILLFSAAVIITTILQGIECFRFYKNYGEIIKRANRIYIGITECTMFLLAVMGRLETIELLTAVAGCLTMEVLNIFWENYTYTEKTSKIGCKTLGMKQYMHLLKMQKIDHGVKIFRKQIEFIFCQWQEQEYYLRHIY